MNKVQILFNELIKKYNLKAITIDNETWYGINDLPMGRKAVNKAISRLRNDLKSGGDFKSPLNFVDDNTKIINTSMVTLNHLRNFDTIANKGEIFGNYKMVNYLIINSRLDSVYKIELIEILDQIRINGFYIDENINSEQIEKLKEELKEKIEELQHEKSQKLYTSKEITSLIDVKGLLSTSIYKYLDELKFGTYGLVNKNRRFTPGDNFKKLIDKGYIKQYGKSIIFTETFADLINNDLDAINRLKAINIEELEIKERGIENKTI